MDDSPLQTALCLIGHPIGGNPTQFVVTRVLASMQLEWQFLSFDVEPSQFSKAIAGIDALGFFGAMIAAPYRTEIAAVLKQLYGDQDTACEGFNDSIFRGTDGKLIAVNLLSRSLEQTLLALQSSGQAACTQLICITDEDDPGSVLNQFLGVLPNKQFIIRGSQLVPWPIGEATLQSEPTEPPDPEKAADASEVPPVTDHTQQTNHTQQANTDSVSDQPAEPSGNAEEGFNEQSPSLVLWQVSGKLSRKVTHVGSGALDTIKDTIAKLPVGSTVVDLSCSYETWLGRQDATRFNYVSRVDLKLRRLAIAIERWTGREPNVEIMREAIEEYLEI